MKLLRVILPALLAIGTVAKPAQAQTVLDKKTSTLVVTYAYIGCTCAQWAINNRRMYTSAREHIFLEPANAKLPEADNLPNGNNIVRLKLIGHFYTKKGFPKNYSPAKGKPAPARVFRYDKIVDISPSH